MYEVRILSNGLKVVLEKIPFVRSVAFGVWIKNGSKNESNKTNGISHFIEHMLFKGTNNRTAKDIANEMDNIGGQLNAYTSKDYTCYYTKTLDIHINIALDVMSDMILNSIFDNNEVKKELNVILEEIDMYEDTPEELVADLLQEGVWKNMPLGRPILGTEETISKFDTNIFKDYYSKNYTIQNTVLSIAGNFDINEITYSIEKYFGKWKNKFKYNCKYKKTIYKPTIISRDKDIEQIHICLGFRGINALSDNIFVLNVFNTIFGDGMSSRLFQRIREDNGLAYSVYSDMYNYIDDGLFTIYACIAYNNIQNVIDIINEEINKIKIDCLLEKDIYNAKQQIKSNYIIGLENTSNIMSALGRSQLLLGYIETPEDVINKIDKVTVDEVLNISSKLLDISNLSLSVVGKINDLNLEQIWHNFM